jgi:hypothetical protein
VSIVADDKGTAVWGLGAGSRSECIYACDFWKSNPDFRDSPFSTFVAGVESRKVKPIFLRRRGSRDTFKLLSVVESEISATKATISAALLPEMIIIYINVAPCKGVTRRVLRACLSLFLELFISARQLAMHQEEKCRQRCELPYLIAIL